MQEFSGTKIAIENKGTYEKNCVEIYIELAVTNLYTYEGFWT